MQQERVTWRACSCAAECSSSRKQRYSRQQDSSAAVDCGALQSYAAAALCPGLGSGLTCSMFWLLLPPEY